MEKIIDFLRSGIHVLVIDLFPTPRDPFGMHQDVSNRACTTRVARIGVEYNYVDEQPIPKAALSQGESNRIMGYTARSDPGVPAVYPGAPGDDPWPRAG